MLVYWPVLRPLETKCCMPLLPLAVFLFPPCRPDKNPPTSNVLPSTIVLLMPTPPFLWENDFYTCCNLCLHWTAMLFFNFQFGNVSTNNSWGQDHNEHIDLFKGPALHVEVSGTLWVCLCVAEAAEGRMDGWLPQCLPALQCKLRMRRDRKWPH